MATFTEGRHAGEHVLSEASGSRSREQGMLASGNLSAGTVLGLSNVGAATTAADAANTGDGTMSAVTVGTGATPGDYQIVYVSASDFEVEDPEGVNLGTGENGVEFSAGGITFTVTAGATAFAAGDTFTITVAAGSGSYAPLDLAATDGSDRAAAVLYGAVDASAGAEPCTVNVRDCEVHGEALTWPDGITADQKAAAIEQLAARGVIVRD